MELVSNKFGELMKRISLQSLPVEAGSLRRPEKFLLGSQVTNNPISKIHISCWPVHTGEKEQANGECKTQNSGLRSKEEKPRDPIDQPSRCNMQEGLLSVAQPGDSDLLGGRAPRTANWASFIYAACYIRVTR